MPADAFAYISAARELVSGRGLYLIDCKGGFSPVFLWGPGFPIALAAFSFVGISPDSAAGILNALLFAVNSFVIGYLLRMYGPKVSWLPILGMIVFIGSTAILKIHAVAMSEPLFICCFLFTFLFLLKYVEQNRKSMLVLAAIFAGWGFLTRYAGVSLFMTGIIIIVVHNRAKLKELLINSLFFTAISCSPMILWVSRNLLLTGKTTGRSFKLHLPDYGYLYDIKETFTNWFIPSSYPLELKTIIGFLALSFLVAIFLLWKPQSRIKIFTPQKADPTNAFLIVTLIFAVCYSLVLLYTTCSVPTCGYLGERVTLPLYLSGMLIIIVAVGDIWLNDKYKWKKHLILSIIIIFIALGLTRSGYWAYVIQKDGWGGYNDPPRCFSETLVYLKNNSNINISKIISNDCCAIYYWTSKSTIEIPMMRYHERAGLPLGIKVGDKRSDFEYKWTRLKEKIHPGWLLVYFFTPMGGEVNFPSEQELQRRLKLVLHKKFGDGSIYMIE